jgi:L-aminopeptidase/D-esterase-like protein
MSGVDSALLAQLGALAADVMAQAVVAAILHAKGIEGYPSYSDL